MMFPRRWWMKPTIKVWPVPRLTEDQLKALFLSIVQTCMEFKQLHVQNENDIIVGFPQDAMEFGLGVDLVVEIGIPRCLVLLREEPIYPEIAVEIGLTIKEFFRRHGYTPSVQCEYHLTHGTILDD